MGDADTTGWRVPPSQYIAGRKAEMAVPAPRSFYLPMRDGVRLAVDVYAHPGKRPTLLIATPYYRRAARVTGSAAEVAPNIAKYRDAFVPRGYNLVAVDVRGTGASFGTRDSFRSPRERADLAVLADWIVAQPWSDGRIGSTGISYLGAGADFLASTGHKAVRAVAPISAVWDTWRDNYWPGGILLTGLVATYERLMIGLDRNRKELLEGLGTFAEPDYLGPLAVDGDDGSLLAAAILEHAGNFSQARFMAEFPFRDSALPYDAAFTPDAFSPCGYAAGIPADVAVYSVGGWTDGAGYANGAISRFLTLARNPAASVDRAVGSWGADELLAVARAGGAGVRHDGRAGAVLRPLPDGAGDGPRCRGAGACVLAGRRALGGGAGLAGGAGRGIVSSAAGCGVGRGGGGADGACDGPARGDGRCHALRTDRGAAGDASLSRPGRRRMRIASRGPPRRSARRCGWRDTGWWSSRWRVPSRMRRSFCIFWMWRRMAPSIT